MLKTKSRAFAPILVLAIGTAAAAALGAQTATDDQAPAAWFIELNGSPDAFRADARAAGIDYSERYVFARLWRGLSVRATADAASRMGGLRSVRAVFPVVTMSLAPRETISPDLAHAVTMTGGDVARTALRLTGKDVKVGVIDTGIDHQHPDLGGGFGPGHRVATGFDFVGDAFDASGSGGALIPHPDKNPDDCNGHGTHVAGIVGAGGTPAAGGARGVAPEVTFGAYRVFGCAGSTSADIMLAAMERALADGMNVVNMSIGAAFQTWRQYPTAVAADALVAAGVVVVTSIGNSGASGVYSASAPGVGKNVIGVASFENSHVNVQTFVAHLETDRVVGYTPLSGTATAAGPPAPPTTGTTPEIVFVGRGCVDGDLAAAGNQTDAYLADPSGKVALISRGVCPFNEKYSRAVDAGALGVIVHNNAAGVFFGGSVISRGVFGIGISLADGQALAAWTAPTATWKDTTIDVANPTAGLTSTFSSYGLTAELKLKPNIGAPGGLIRSTVPLEQGGYAIISGTSMASPHVAGAVALYLESHRDATPAAVKAALQNSADPVAWTGNPGFREPVHRQGAGMLDIDDAITARTTITPSELSLGEGSTPHVHTLTIANRSDAPLTYTVGHVPAPGTANTFAPVIVGNFASLGASAVNVSVPAGETATVTVTITPNAAAALARTVYGGYITLNDGARIYRVPYAGLAGDYQTIQVLAPGGCAAAPFPGIFRFGGETVCAAATPTAAAVKLDIPVTPQAEGATFNVEDRTDRPIVLYHRAHQSIRLEIRAVDANTGTSYLVASGDYLSRNATDGVSLAAGGFSTYTWDGKRQFTNAAGKVQRQALPAGPYKLQLVVTKALAEPGNAAHIETRTLPTVIITRN